MLLALLLMAILGSSKVKANTTVKVGVYQNRPLSFIEKEGEVKGLFIDVIEHIAQKENWTIDYVPETWTQCLKNLEVGDIDVLGVIAFTHARNKRFDFNFAS